MSFLNNSYFSVESRDGHITFYFSFFNERLPSLTAVDYLILSSLCILTAVSALENIFLITFIITHKQLRTITNIFVANIALISLLLTPLTAIVCSAIYQAEWYLGDSICKFSVYSIMQISFQLIWNKAAIAAERHRKITTPFKSQLNLRAAVVLAVVVWLVGAVIVVPVVIHQKEITAALGNKTYRICSRESNMPSVMVIALALFFGFFVPLLVIVICYKQVLDKISATKAKLKQRLRLAKNNIEVSRSQTDDSTIDSGNTAQPDIISLKVERNNKEIIAGKQVKNRHNHRVVKILILIVVVFLTLWIPNIVLMGGIMADLSLETFKLRARYNYAGLSLLNINAIITPLLYVFSDKNIIYLLRNMLKKGK